MSFVCELVYNCEIWKPLKLLIQWADPSLWVCLRSWTTASSSAITSFVCEFACELCLWVLSWKFIYDCEFCHWSWLPINELMSRAAIRSLLQVSFLPSFPLLQFFFLSMLALLFFFPLLLHLVGATNTICWHEPKLHEIPLYCFIPENDWNNGTGWYFKPWHWLYH